MIVIHDNSWTELLNQCLEFKTTRELGEFFDLLFTYSEKYELANRLLIIRELLNENKPQRKIAKELKVSIANISRGSNALKVISPDLKRALKK